jgi:hypothetical protein
MNTRIDRRQLAIDLCTRSTCRTKMAAVCSDRYGIFSWGWNSAGPSGLGTHAEEHAVQRANRRRLQGCTVTVAGFRSETRSRFVLSCPCSERCWPLLKRVGVKTIEFIHPDGHWTFYRLSN